MENIKELLRTGKSEEIRKVLATLPQEELVDVIMVIHEAFQDSRTPGNTHSEDPFADYVERERAELTLGDYTDDALANAVYLYGNITPPIESVLAGTRKMPIVYLTAAKERIRWLSRKVIGLQTLLDGYLTKDYPNMNFHMKPLMDIGEFQTVIESAAKHMSPAEVQLSTPLTNLFKQQENKDLAVVAVMGDTPPRTENLVPGLDVKVHDLIDISKVNGLHPFNGGFRRGLFYMMGSANTNKTEDKDDN